MKQCIWFLGPWYSLPQDDGSPTPERGKLNRVDLVISKCYNVISAIEISGNLIAVIRTERQCFNYAYLKVL